MSSLLGGFIGFLYGMVFGLAGIYVHEFHKVPFWISFPLSMVMAAVAAVGTVYAFFFFGWAG